MSDLFAPLVLKRGPAMKNRFMLAPLTNEQNEADGRVSAEDRRWLEMRAMGGFGAVMTCAAHVHPLGRGFAGQLGIFSDDLIPGLSQTAAAIKAQGSVALVQIHHAGMRAPRDLIGEAPVSPSGDDKTGARALSEAEIEQLIEDFIAGAVRAKVAGFDGVELHGAHGYLLCQFLSLETNSRSDRFGGSLENRASVIRAILSGIRARCGENFQLGIRLSPERFGLKLAEMRELAGALMAEGAIDFLDMSLWDIAKDPVEAEHKGRSLMAWFTDLDRHGVALGVAGKVYTGRTAREALENGADFVLIGRGAVLHHDFPKRVAADADFEPIALPVSPDYLRGEGLSDAFIRYMGNWKGFVGE